MRLPLKRAIALADDRRTVIRRVLFTLGFLVLVAALTRWSSFLDDAEVRTSYEGSWVILAGICALAGFVEGRWWVLLLPPLTWVAVWAPGLTGEQRGFFLVFGVPSLFIGLLVGVMARSVLRATRRRLARHSSTSRVDAA